MSDKILVIDNDLEILKSTCSLLEEWGYIADQAHGGRDGIIKGASPDYAIILIDYRMPGINGIEVAKELKKINSESILLMYSCDKSREATIEAWEAGVVKFVDKDLALPELQKLIKDYCQEYHLSRKLLRNEMPPSVREEFIASVGMVGRSTQLAEIVRIIKKYSENRYSVLVVGETGVGKELAARALHVGPEEKFKSLNCAAFKSSQLLESELFGSEKGAFTGAMSRIGIIEAANGGTVFFDELHQLDLDAQSKLLRTFQEKTIKRVGGRDEYGVNFRIVAAAQPDVEQRVADGRFQEDLFNRINVLRIDIPPLRERPEDIEPLVRHFCNLHFEKTGERKFFLAETIRCFERHDWVGNVRVLENYVNRLLVNVSEEIITPKYLDKKIFIKSLPSQPIIDYSLFRKRQENELREYFQEVLRSCNNNAAEAASIIGIAPTTFYDLIHKLKIRNNRKNNDLEIDKRNA
jgi:DNA-binding NtrC family response regulator